MLYIKAEKISTQLFQTKSMVLKDIKGMKLALFIHIFNKRLNLEDGEDTIHSNP